MNEKKSGASLSLSSSSSPSPSSPSPYFPRRSLPPRTPPSSYHQNGGDSNQHVGIQGNICHALIRSICQRRWNEVESILSSRVMVDKLTVLHVQEFAASRPLHIACSINSVPITTIEKLLVICRPWFETALDEDGNLPIHIACSTKDIDPQIIIRLLKEFPKTGKKNW